MSDESYLETLLEHNPEFGAFLQLRADPAFDESVRAAERLSWVRVVAPDQGMAVGDLVAAVEAALGEGVMERLGLTVVPSDVLPCAALIQKSTNDKSTALRHVAQTLGLTAADFCAFGDDLNDLQMLEWAGHSISPANGKPEAHACAKAVSDLSNDQDFIAAALSPVFRVVLTGGPW